MRHISGTKPRPEAASFVEAMHAGIGAAALHQHVVTISRPGFFQRGVQDGTAMALPAKRGMGHDIFEETVPTARTQQIRRCDQHAGRNDP